MVAGVRPCLVRTGEDFSPHRSESVADALADNALTVVLPAHFGSLLSSSFHPGYEEADSSYSDKSANAPLPKSIHGVAENRAISA